MRWTDVVTALIAVYAAGLSTYTFFVERRDKHLRLDVRLTVGFIPGADDVAAVLLINVRNPGQRPAQINNVGLVMPDKRQLVCFQGRGLGGTEQLPCTCASGANALFWVVPAMVADELMRSGINREIQLRAFTDEATGTRCHSKAMTFKPDQWKEG